MKKLLIALVLAFICVQGHAQFYAGGTFGFTFSTLAGAGGMSDFDYYGTGGDYEDYEDASSAQKGFSFKILPEFGYHLSLSMAAGISLGYIKGYAALGSIDITDFKALLNSAISTAADTQSEGSGYSAIRLAPYIRYTMVRKGGFEIFTDAGVGFNYIMNKSSTNYFSLEFCLRPGVSFAISDSVKLLAKMGSLGFQHLRDKDGGFKLTRFGLDIDGNNMMLGAVYYF